MKNVWSRESVLLYCYGNGIVMAMLRLSSLSYLAESCRLCAAMFRLYRRKVVQSVVSWSGVLLFQGAGKSKRLRTGCPAAEGTLGAC